MSRSRQKLRRPDPDGMDSVFSNWRRDDPSRQAHSTKDAQKDRVDPTTIDDQPIEPDRAGAKGPGVLRWVFFLLVVAYTLFSYFHEPILSYVGGFLVVEDPLKRADLIVCTPDYPVEQCLSAAEFYHKGLSSRIFWPDAPAPPGIDTLKQRGGSYPSTTALCRDALEGLGVKGAAIVTVKGAGGTRLNTAQGVKQVVQANDFHRLIIVTPPWRARLTRAVFTEAFKNTKVDLMIAPAAYSGFKKNRWWKRPPYLSGVFFEYQRLLWHTLRHLW